MEPSELSGPTMIELVWRERLPLGMNLLLNDESGKLKVVDFPRGSQARIVCEARGFLPEAFEGASIVAVNGTRYEDNSEEELFEALKDPGRPKSVGFFLAETEEAERLRLFVENARVEDVDNARQPRSFVLRHALFQDQLQLGIHFARSPDNSNLVVKGFYEGEDGVVLAAERNPDIEVGDLLTHVNDETVVCFDGSCVGDTRAIGILEASCITRPLKLSFSEPFMHSILLQQNAEETANSSFTGGPEELVLDEQMIGDTSLVCICGFNNMSGAVESGGVLLGDHLVFLNGEPVGVGCHWMSTGRGPSLGETNALLQSPQSFPIALTFARPKVNASSPRWGTGELFSDSDAKTICVTAESYDQLGMTLESHPSGSGIVVENFLPVAGIFQRTISSKVDVRQRPILESVNQRVLPPSSNVQHVKSAIERSWKVNRSVHVRLSNSPLKEWLKQKVSNPGSAEYH